MMDRRRKKPDDDKIIAEMMIREEPFFMPWNESVSLHGKKYELTTASFVFATNDNL